MRTWQVVVLSGALSIAGAAGAQAPAKSDGKKADAKADGKKTEAKPGMDPASMFPKPGAETKALTPFIGSLKLKGTMAAGSMGPGSPVTETAGTHDCKWTTDNLWVDCEVVEGPTDPKAQKWNGHVRVGWDYMVKAYRAVVVDNMGGAMMMEGKMTGPKLTMESVGNYQMMGKPMKMRMTFDMTDPKLIKVTEEHNADGKWMVVHESTGTKAGK